MKTKIFITGAIFCAMAAAPAHAVVTCVALGSNTMCSSQGSGGGEFRSACTTNGIQVDVKGVIGCSEDEGSIGATQSGLTVSSGNLNYQCWCRMISPAVSSWVLAGKQGDNTGQCVSRCAAACAQKLESSTTFRSAMFSNLSE